LFQRVGGILNSLNKLKQGGGGLIGREIEYQTGEKGWSGLTNFVETEGESQREWTRRFHLSSRGRERKQGPQSRVPPSLTMRTTSTIKTYGVEKSITASLVRKKI